ncbi:unnamed protein product [Amoebophrya sp. A25]|nr:unnamed protein product [Amoebophrya sp. A25]|eukprot:GSA25T00003927001.1
MMNNNCGYYGNKSRPGYAHSHSGSSLPQTQQPSSGGYGHQSSSYGSQSTEQPRQLERKLDYLASQTKKVPSRRNSLSRDSDTYDMHASSGSRFVQTTMIDSVTAIPDDLYRRMESEANIDRGVHVPKKKNGQCVLLHTGVY